MNPFGSDHDTIKPATIHIIHAIRCLYAQSCPKVTSQWTQSHPHMLKKAPNRPQSDPAHSGFIFLGTLVAFLKSKILRKNEYILFMDPFGSDHDTIKPATIHIIHAIRRLYAQSCPKVTSQWTQSHAHMLKKAPDQPQINPKSTRYLYKVIKKYVGEMGVF